MRHLSFRQRQFLILLALAIVPLAFAAAMGLSNARDSIIRHTTAQLETVADLKTVQVQHWLDEGREVARLISDLHDLRKELPTLLALRAEPFDYYAQDKRQDEAPPDAEALAQADLYAEVGTIVNIFPHVQSVSLLHPTSGQLLLSTDPTQEGRERRDEDYFRSGQQALYISPVAYSVGREAPVLNVSAPVRGEGGQLLAVVAVEMDLSDLEATLSSRAGLGQTGRAYLVEAYGFYVTLPPDLAGGPLRTIAESEGVRRALAGQNGYDTYLDPRGVRVLGVCRWLPEENLGLLVEIEEAELISQIRRTATLIILTNLGVLALAVVAARYLTHWLVTPLEQIAGAARALQAGDLSHRAPPGGPDEIGQLAAAFNEMADSLQRYYENLEQLVEQRTAALQAANEELEQEITERKRAEGQIKAALAEKEVLLREIHHRVKNNLQVIIYLIDMQADYIADPQVLQMLKELQERARVMGLVHEQLYQSQDLAQIDFGAYLQDLTANLWQAFGTDPAITLQVNAAKVFMSVDKAIPCGLIVNELVTNALKYAFPKDLTGFPKPVRSGCEICVAFESQDGQYVLTVSDNGVGLPPDLDWRTAKSLGLQLVNIWATYQLGGSLELDTQSGTAFKITFAERKNLERKKRS